MTIEKSHASNLEKNQQSEKSADKVLAKDIITGQQQNDQVDRIKVLDALKSFKLTADGQQSFAIDLGDGNSVKDSRESRRVCKEESLVPVSAISEEQRYLDSGAGQIATARGVEHSDGKRIPSERLPGHEGRADFPDYSHKDVRTKAPEDVTVIGAEGSPGKLFEYVNGKEIPLPLEDVIKQIEDIQIDKKQKKDEPKLAYIEACHSGEDAPAGSTASQIAKATQSYVVGNIGFGDSYHADTTKPPVHIPIINVDIPNPNPDAHDKVRLFNPEGKPIGDFNTPVDWREVKKAVQEDILKHKN
jgi:hypothetical protein